MWSRRPVCARPVRTLARSVLNACTLLSIFWSVVFFSSAITIAVSRNAAESYVNQGPLVLAENHAAQRVLLEDAEHGDRQLLVPAQSQRAGVHHPKITRDCLVETDARVALRARLALRVGRIDAVALGRLDHDLGGQFAAA